jgi:hypothetical protein
MTTKSRIPRVETEAELWWATEHNRISAQYQDLIARHAKVINERDRLLRLNEFLISVLNQRPEE